MPASNEPTPKDSSLPKKPSESKHDHFDKGNNAFNHSDWKRAIEAYTKAIEEKPGFALAYLNRGTAYLRQSFDQSTEEATRAGFRENVLKDYEKALVLDEELGTARIHLAIGDMYRTKGEYASSIVALNKAIAKDDKLAPAFMIRATTYTILGNLKIGQPNLTVLKKGVDDAKRASELDSRFKSDYRQMSDTYEKLRILVEAMQ